MSVVKRARCAGWSGALAGLAMAGSALVLVAAGAGPCLAAELPGAAAAGAAASGSVLGWGQDSWGQLGNGADPAGQATPVNVSLPAGTLVTGVSAGYDHSLAVTSSGGVLAFGRNDSGALGNGSTTDSDTPVPVSLPAGTAVTQASAGNGFSLAATTTGGALAWGDDEEGELGNGAVLNTPVTAPVPVQLPWRASVTQVAAGTEDWGLALTSAGQVLAWGSNFAGQLGDDSTIGADTPGQVELPSSVAVTQIAAGADTGYALTSTGTVYAWGSGAGGTLGDASTASAPLPVPVQLPAGVTITKIAATGGFALALTSTGQVLAWGGGSQGQLGDGGTANSDVPVPVRLPTGVTVAQIAAGGDFAAVATTTGQVLAWGGNVWGELGDGGTTSSDTPVPVQLPAGTHVDVLAAGQDHALALPAPAPHVTGIRPQDGLPGGGGTLTITGTGFTGATKVSFGTAKATSLTVNSDSQLTAVVPAGTGRVNVTVTSPGGTSAASPLDQYTYLAKGAVLDWGSNANGELGNGTTFGSDVPVAAHLPAGTVVTEAAKGFGTSYALTSTGAVYAWGFGIDGELGNGAVDVSSALPVRVSFPAGTVITAIAAGGFDGYALTSTGRVLAWGDNIFGELGDGTKANSAVPVAVRLPSGTKVAQLCGEARDGLVRTATGKVYAWGQGSSGGLGDGMRANSLVAVAVKLPAGIAAASIACAEYDGYARTTAGMVYAWGFDPDGELGNGTTIEQSVTPVKVSLAAGTVITAIAAAGFDGYALTKSGHVLSWGYGADGELGDGMTSRSDVPVTVSLPASTKVTALSAEDYGGLVRTGSGGLLAWGGNFHGDLGNGSTGNSLRPVPVRLPAGVTASEVGNSFDDGGIAVVSPVA